MAIQRFGLDAWFITHPGFERNPNDYPPDTHYMSYEFASWITGWERGVVGNDEFHARNFKIARRKSCYPQPLMNELGLFTQAGEQVLARAQIYMSQIKSYYQGIGIASVADVPLWDQVDDMDRILVASLIETKHILFLRALYSKQYEDKSTYTHMGQVLPNDMQFEFTAWNGKDYMTTSALRNHPSRRKSFEFLVKMGLIELHNLPKTVAQHGRGKNPIGVLLTNQGRKFFEDYLERYDPMNIKKQEASRWQQESS